MPLLLLITVAGLAMAAIALVGSVTLVLSERALQRVLLPLVALAAGSLIGGALFHLLPEAVDELGNELEVYVALVAGLVVFFMLEQFLHWHHYHQPVSRHQPMGYLILLADGLHNLIGGLAVGGAFVVDVERRHPALGFGCERAAALGALDATDTPQRPPSRENGRERSSTCSTTRTRFARDRERGKSTWWLWATADGHGSGEP